MNDFSSKALLLWAALKQHETTPTEWKQTLLNGMLTLSDQLLAHTEGYPEHDYEHRYLKTIQQYIESAFKNPAHKISDMALDLCCRILPGIPDDDNYA